VDDDGLVGRGRELAELMRRLEAAQAGSGGLVLVEGDAGAGKTALAHSVVRRARRAGMRTAWGACLESEGAAPYRPWAQILRELGQSATPLLDPVGGASGSRDYVFDDVVEVLKRRR
jgi:predicted ATPase